MLFDCGPMSRKRLRTDDILDVDEGGGEGESRETAEERNSLLKARALLCMSDAMIMEEGLTDESDVSARLSE